MQIHYCDACGKRIAQDPVCVSTGASEKQFCPACASKVKSSGLEALGGKNMPASSSALRAQTTPSAVRSVRAGAAVRPVQVPPANTPVLYIALGCGALLLGLLLIYATRGTSNTGKSAAGKKNEVAKPPPSALPAPAPAPPPPPPAQPRRRQLLCPGPRHHPSRRSPSSLPNRRMPSTCSVLSRPLPVTRPGKPFSTARI